jgi:hypothetical protein
MMGQGFGEEIGKSICLGLTVLVIFVFALGAIAMWGLPKLWELAKPFIHAMTI